jgi:hypothetical protein
MVFKTMGRTTISTAALLVGVILGIVTALHGLGTYGLKPVANAPRWFQWQVSGNDQTMIYALGHFLGDGQLPPPKSAASYLRSVDDEGNGLRADCTYVIEGKVTPSRWWSMSVAEAGEAAPQSELTAGEAVVSQQGDIRVAVSARPMPGNWIVPASSSGFTLHYVVYEAVPNAEMMLPAIKKTGC